MSRRSRSRRHVSLRHAQALWRCADEFRDAGELAAATAAMREAMALERDARLMRQPRIVSRQVATGRRP